MIDERKRKGVLRCGHIIEENKYLFNLIVLKTMKMFKENIAEHRSVKKNAPLHFTRGF